MIPSLSEVDLSTDSVSSLLGRAYYLNLGRLEEHLKRAGLYDTVQPGMCNVLFALYRKDEQRISDIADHLMVAKSTMTGTVDRMKRRGLISVERDPVDRRAHRLRLTAKARTLKLALRRVVTEVEDEIFRALDRGEDSSFKRLLEKAISAMSREA